MTTTEQQIELDLIAKLGDLKYTYRPDIRDRAALEAVDVAKPLGSAVDIGRDDAVEQALKLAVSQMHAVQRFELGSEV
ncbi:TPA: hypothetical protein NIB80_005770, partial [Pseudomonas aeruginosa]|nr:hypothetical protein [Pseudomonas aeruginosa]